MTGLQIRHLLKRIKNSPDGLEFMEYLKFLSGDNYDAWKVNGSELNDIHKGYAKCVDSLLESFANCDKENTKPDIGNWS